MIDIIMKIKYKKWRSGFYLIMIITWLILFILNIVFVEGSNWKISLLTILPLVYIPYYTYEYFNQYLKIDNGYIYKTSLFPKKLELTKIVTVKKFAGDYIIKTDQTELRIDTKLIHPDSLKELDKVLITYNTSSNDSKNEIFANE